MKTILSVSATPAESEVEKLLEFLGFGKPSTLFLLSSGAFTQYAAKIPQLTEANVQAAFDTLRTLNRAGFQQYLGSKARTAWASAPYSDKRRLHLDAQFRFGTLLVGFENSKEGGPYIKDDVVVSIYREN